MSSPRWRTSFFPLLKYHVLPNDGIVFAKEQLVCQLAGVLAGEVHETRVGRRHELDKNGFQLRSTTHGPSMTIKDETDT